VITARTKSVDDTRALGAALAELSRPGDLLLLAGDLGAGKTALAQGFGRGLGVRDPITSPTFTLARQYEGRLPLNHLDVYRIDQLDEVADIGLPELLDEGAVTLIEWGDAIVPVLPADFLEIRLTFGEGDDDREIAVRPVGPTWSARSRAVTTVIEPWLDMGGEGRGGRGPC
jgi:tRNA threonylcarbamoyladenosine biosynthesis protein TsaE